MTLPSEVEGTSHSALVIKSMLIPGRHTPWGGAANVETGVTFDLQKLNQVDVSADRKTAAIGPGNRWGNVYPKLDAMKLAMVGGRVSPVGAGGLITGGKPLQ